jgi:transposase InsO family protein
MADYISVSEALKLVSPFKGDRKEVLAFISNVDTAFEVINPDNAGTLYKFVLTRISGEPRVAITHRNLENWEDLRTFLKNTYTEKRTLDFHATQLFGARQGKSESISDWIQNVQRLSSKFREAALQDCEEDERQGIVALADKLRNICFVQGIVSDRIQTIVRSRNGDTFDEIAETALEEESAIFSKNERYRQGPSPGKLVCHNCGKAGHVAAKCYLKDKKDVRVSKLGAEPGESAGKPRGIRRNEIKCYNCGEAGHIARECRKPRNPRKLNQVGSVKAEDRPPERSNFNIGSINAIGSGNRTNTECVRLQTDISNGHELLLLVDTGADISLLKPTNLDKDGTYNPDGKVKVKGVDGSVIETLGTVRTVVRAEFLKIPFTFQLVNKQVDIPCDGILGRDFLEHAGAQICYASGTLTFGTGRGQVSKPLSPISAESQTKRVRRLVLPGRAELIVKLPVRDGTHVWEGVTEKQEIQKGVYLAGAMTKVQAGYAITSIANTNSEEVEIEEPELEVTEIVQKGREGTCEKGRKKGVDRAKEVLKRLSLDHLNDEERQQIEKICTDYHDIFHLQDEVLTSTPVVQHEIRLEPGTQPVNIKPYRLPEAQKQEARRQVEELKRGGIIEESNSPWNSPLLVVKKKADASGEEKWRLVIDYRKVNEKTVGDAYPLPDVTEILDQLGQSRYFSCIDMVMGYHQIEVAEKDRAITAFSTKEGHWEYKRLPFGLKTAPATFQRMMNVAMSGLTGSRCFVFLDDICVYARSLSEHDSKLREVFGRLRRYNLKLKAEKCQFLRKEVSYLGHVISEKGVFPERAKTKVIEEYPIPQNVKQLRSFLGLMSYYRRFVPKFSHIAAPLHKLLKKEAPYEWTAEQEQAFHALKGKLISPPVLKYPDFHERFILTTDASGEGLGAVLSQGKIGKDLPVAFASRTLHGAEKNYSTTEKEFLAIVWGMKYFRPYLFGRAFTVVTDHKPLTWIMSVKDPGSRLLKWRIKMEEYEYEVVYKKGALNTNADALSRINKLTAGEGLPEEKRERVTEEETKAAILYEYHDSPVGGHRGMNRTFREIRKKYDWPNMKRDVEEYVKRCKSCQVNKNLGPRHRAPMEITTTAKQPFQRCALDIVGPTDLTNKGNRYILTFQDDLTKFMAAIPIPTQDAETVAREFVQNIVLKYGIPEEILTDQGANFLSDIFANVCKLLQIKKIQTTAFHPASNGGLERGHRVIIEYLRHYIAEDQKDWDDWVAYATFVYNVTSHRATGYSPFELLYGYKARMPSALQAAPTPRYDYDDYVGELRGRLQSAHAIARENLLQSKARSKLDYDKKIVPIALKTGDKVLLFDESVRRGRSRKLSTQWVGPYVVLEVTGVNATIKKGRNAIKVHVNRLKPFF